MTLKKTVYLVRHGESRDNVQPVFQAYDSRLSEKGEDQATKLAARTRHLAFDTLISSPQPRALQTAQKIADVTGQKIETSDLFIERFKPSSIDGKSVNDPEAAALWRDWQKTLTKQGSSRVQNGETYEDLTERTVQALNYLEQRPEKRLLVVSHSHIIRAMLAHILFGEALTPDALQHVTRSVSIENTGITTLHYRDEFEDSFRWRIWTLNDHAHFAE